MSRLVVALLTHMAPTAAAFKSGWYPPLSGGATQYLPYFDDPPMIACVHAIHGPPAWHRLTRAELTRRSLHE